MQSGVAVTVAVMAGVALRYGPGAFRRRPAKRHSLKASPAMNGMLFEPAQVSSPHAPASIQVSSCTLEFGQCTSWIEGHGPTRLWQQSGFMSQSGSLLRQCLANIRSSNTMYLGHVGDRICLNLVLSAIEQTC